VKVTLRGSWAERGLLASFSLPALLNSSLRSPVNWLCIAMLVNQPGGYAEMGLLHAVNPWFLLLMFLPGQLANVYYPMFEDALARGNRAELRQLVWKSMRLNSVVCAALAAAIAAWAEGVLDFYGPGYGKGTWVLRLSMLTGLVIAVSQPLSAYLVSVANMWVVTACSAAWAAVFVIASYALLPYGARGVAGARFLGYAAYAVLVVALALRMLRQSPAVKNAVVTRPLPEAAAA
jgi:O-antigen/teichoic acid export membrane protein